MCWGRSHCRHCPTAPGLTTQGSCRDPWGPYRHPTARGQDSGEQHPVGTGMTPSPPDSSSCPSQLWETPWSLRRAAGTSGPTASTGPGPAVERCGRDGGAAGACGGPAGGGEGRGPRSELKMCRGECPGRPRGRKGRASPGSAWLRPQHIASPGPEPSRGSSALLSQPAGRTGVKVPAAPALGGRNRVLPVLALGEAGVTPAELVERRP